MIDLPDFDTLLPKPEKRFDARVVMVDEEGRPTKKRDLCYMWTRERFGFGWHYPAEEPIPEF